MNSYARRRALGALVFLLTLEACSAQIKTSQRTSGIGFALKDAAASAECTCQALYGPLKKLKVVKDLTTTYSDNKTLFLDVTGNNPHIDLTMSNANGKPTGLCIFARGNQPNVKVTVNGKLAGVHVIQRGNLAKIAINVPTGGQAGTISGDLLGNNPLTTVTGPGQHKCLGATQVANDGTCLYHRRQASERMILPIADASGKGACKVEDDALGPFTIERPTGTITDTQKPTVHWTKSLNAATYDVSISQHADCSLPVQTFSKVKAQSVVPRTPLPFGQYFSCVAAFDADGIQTRLATNNGLPFEIVAPILPLTPPHILTPSGLVTGTNTPAVTWTASQNAKAYDVALASTPDCAAPTQIYRDVTGTTQTTKTLAPGDYFSCVTAKDGSGQTLAADNDGLAFSIPTPPPPLGPFAILGPTGIFEDMPTPTVTWQAAAGAQTYDVVIAATPTCSIAVQTFANVATTTATPAPLADGTYYVCATAKGEGGQTVAATNNGLSFQITSAPLHLGEFAILPPAGIVETSTSVIQWTSSSRADAYDVSISRTPSCTDPVQKLDNVAALEVTTQPLADGTYYICVAAEKGNESRPAANNGVELTIRTTGEPLGAFSIVEPSGIIVDNRAPRISWTSSVNAVSYDVTLAVSPDCADPLQSWNDVTSLDVIPEPLADGRYYTCVVAANARGETLAADNDGLVFVIRTTPRQLGLFTIEAPKGTFVGDFQPTVRWTPSMNAATYDVVISRLPDCLTAVQTVKGLTGTTLLPQPLLEGAYFTCITARDGTGQSRPAENDGLAFEIRSPTQPLGAFKIVSPTGTIVGNATPLVQWTAASQAVVYDVMISAAPDCSAAVQVQTGLAGLSTPTGPLVDGTYYACVTAHDAIGQGRFADNNGLMFSIVTPPPPLGPFTIVGPTGTVVGGQAPQIAWTPSDVATSYDVKIALTSDCAAPLQVISGVTGTSTSAQALDDGTYFVCVTAHGDAGQVQSSDNDGFRFTVKTLPPPLGAFTILTPSGTYTDFPTPAITWTAAAYATSYDVRIAKASNCTNVAQVFAGVTSTSVTPTALADGKYYTCVTAKDMNGQTRTADNDALPFTIKTSPVQLGIFAILSPSGLILDNPAPTAEWTASSGAKTYDLVISSTPDCATVVQRRPGLTSTVSALSPLADGVYYTCVTAKDSSGRTRPSENDGLRFELKTRPNAYHLAFVTSMELRIDGSPDFPPTLPGFGHLDAADWICTKLASQAGLILEWDGQTLDYRALVSIAGLGAKDRLASQVGLYAPILTTRYDELAGDSNELWSGNLRRAVNLDEMGVGLAAGANPWVFTGTNTDGTWSGKSCAYLNDRSTKSQFTRGDTSASNGAWVSAGLGTCDQMLRLYCVSTPIQLK